MTKLPVRLRVACVALYGLAHGLAASATDVATRPINAGGLVKPNVIFGFDDSSSMEWDVLLDTTQGMLNWSSGTAWSSTGVPLRPLSCSYGHLFPLGTDFWGIGDCYGDAVPPTAQFASMRSSAYNPLYYDPNVTYKPWKPAYLNGASKTFANSTPTAASSNPANPSALTMNLTANQSNSYNMQSGMTLPAGGTATKQTSVSISYYPATYYVKMNAASSNTMLQNCVVDNVACVSAPDGGKLKRFEIKSGNVFPTGRSYADELQNFANWWSYYRTRTLMAAASMGLALDQLSGLRLGVTYFSNTSLTTPPTMYDADAASDSANRRSVAGLIYRATVNRGTPTYDALANIGYQYSNSPAIIQYACQRNNAFIVTDGFADRAYGTNLNVTLPTYDKTLYTKNGTNSWPYLPVSTKSLADIALDYYTSMDGSSQKMRPDLALGKVPLQDPSVVNADRNPNLHMNTYAVTLGVKGLLWPANSDPFAASISWPSPPTIDTQQTIDDLWHDTINGRGQMYTANNSIELAARIAEGLNDMNWAAGGQATLAARSPNLATGDSVYQATYNAKGWAGDLLAKSIDKANGNISATASWQASARLNTSSWSNRVIATSSGTTGVPFTAANVGAALNPNGDFGSNDALVDYLRGNRAGEGTAYRTRTSLLGAILNAQPVVSAADGVIYAASGEGMLHAFDMGTGDELWAYVPAAALAGMGASSQRTWSFKTLLDGSPSITQLGTTKLLVAGRGVAGSGYFALDVTSPRGLNSDALASKVKWDFPSQQGITTAGLAVGKPLAAATRSQGNVVLLTQGYNGSNDGTGRVYMLDAMTGALKHTFNAAGGLGSGDPGLAHISGLSESDGTVAYAYGGDERGNLWKFDLNSLTVMRIAQLKDASGNPQPITTAPELTRIGGSVVVLVGTGRLLGLADLGSTQQQSFYAIKDSGAELTNARTSLVARVLATRSDGRFRLESGALVDWSTGRGWYFDLPAGQQANTDSMIVFGSVVFSANKMSAATCSGASYDYTIDVSDGKNGAGRDYAGEPLADATVSGVNVVVTQGAAAGSTTGATGGGGGGGGASSCTNGVLQLFHDSSGQIRT
ncbi:MAG TPA: PilC/PilY family type IV pilus protein, partial [Burkholderiaceae bacterium]|nr:PilC/PilY family type IV pilus protein [Burkholderiaceae bacterium]